MYTHFLRRNDRYVVLVDEPRLLLDLLRVALALELLAGRPEGDILVAVLGHEELAEELAPDGVAHHPVEGRAPRAYLLEADVVDVAVEAVASSVAGELARQVASAAMLTGAEATATAARSYRRRATRAARANRGQAVRAPPGREKERRNSVSRLALL